MQSSIECNKVITVPQYTGTCWFNAIMMAVFFSENMKKVVSSKKSTWSHMSPKLRKTFKDLIKRSSEPYTMKDYAYMFFKAITPDNILKLLNKEDSNRFNFNPDKKDGYFNTLYLPALLHYLNIDAVHYDVLIHKKQNELYYSNIYNEYKIITNKKKKDVYHIEYDGYKKIDTKNFPKRPDVITLRFRDETRSTVNLIGTIDIGDVVTVNKKRYIVDSLLLSNFNKDVCHRGHDIAGVTCNNKRYLYNGWIQSTRDASMLEARTEPFPCELIPYDWLEEGYDFCIDPKRCGLKQASDKQKNLCFNFHNGPRTYLCVSEELYKDKKISPKKLMTPPMSQSKKQIKSEIEIDKTKPKECPPDKILNPATNRCIKRDSVVAKKILSNINPTSKPKKPTTKTSKPKECPPDKILNPTTNRCVKRDSALGKKLASA